MKKTLVILSLLTALALTALQSCQYEWIEFEETEIPDVVSLSNDLIPIFEASCNTNVCHGGSADPDLRPDKAFNALISGGYVDTSNPEQSSLYTCLLAGGSMEQYAEPGDAELILAWIEQGAKNN
jgi:hypothetical protein